MPCEHVAAECRSGSQVSVQNSESDTVQGVSRSSSTHGYPAALSAEEEAEICECLLVMSEWGFPMTKADLRHFVRVYIENKDTNVSEFVENLPGEDWANGFLKRHKKLLSERVANNIKRARADVGSDIIKQYFENLTVTLENIRAANIFNYYETNGSVSRCLLR